MPRISIDHKNGLFKNSLNGETFPVLRAVMLGVIKQRVMFHPQVDDGDKPMCKSPDFNHGFPNESDEQPKDKRFPWAKSNFDRDTVLQEVNLDPSPEYPQGWSSNGHGVLPCKSCIFSMWDRGDWKQPPCAEQHTYPLMLPVDGDEVNFTGALISFQKTGIKPSKQYINGFYQARIPMFTKWTEISLQRLSRGTVDYCVPVFKKAGDTDENYYGEWSEALRSVRIFVRQAPRPNEDYEPPEPSDNVNAGPTQVPVATAAAVSQPAPVASTAPPAQSTPSARRPGAAVAAPPASSAPSPSAPEASTPSAPTSNEPPAGDADEDLPF
jgi:hypothetical protein